MIVKGNDGGEYQRPEPGTYLARCIRIVDIGTQTGEYQGQPTVRRQVVITWELPTELMTGGEYDGMPFVVSKFYTASLNEKATLRRDLTNWRSKDFTEEELLAFDLSNILGKACMITYAPNSNGRLVVSGVMACPKGTTCPKQVNPSVNFDLAAFDIGVFSALSPKMQELIKLSPEYADVMRGHKHDENGLPQDPMGDDIPF